MAALYLHHALFTPEPPLLPQRNSNSDTEPLPGLPAVILRSTSSVSTVTLRGSDSFKIPHHSEPLLDPVSPEATTAFLDIPITSLRDLDHPPDPGYGWLGGPRFERDLARASNGRWPLDGIWRRLRRLKLLYALSFTVIGAPRPINITSLLDHHSQSAGRSTTPSDISYHFPPSSPDRDKSSLFAWAPPRHSLSLSSPPPFFWPS